MKFTTTQITSLCLLLATSVHAAGEQEVAFLTALVGDYQSHRTEYIKYFATATGIPGALSTLATQVLTYTDDSYTTLLNGNNAVNVGELESYATNIPWYTRIEAAAGDSGSGSNSGSGSGSGSGSDSSSGSSSDTEATTTTSNGASIEAPTLTRSSTSYSPPPTGDAATTVTRQAPVSTDGVANVIAPIGAAVGAMAFALL